MLQRILSSVENYEEVDLRFRDIEKIDDLSIVLSILDRNNTQYLSITF